MAESSSGFFKSTLLAGIITGLLSAIPVISGFNCCCLWFLLGGFWASYLLWHCNHSITIGRGIGAGVAAGVYAAFVYSVLNTIAMQFTSDNTIAEMEQIFEQTGSEMPSEIVDLAIGFISSPFIAFIAFLMISLIVFPIAMGLGGLFGALILKNRGQKKDN